MGKVDGFGDVGVHARGAGGGDVLGKGVGRHGDDGHLARVRPPQGADAARGLAAVHHRHLHVHEDGVEGESLRLSEALDSLRTVPSLRDGHAVHLQKLGGDLHVDFVVLGQQDALALEGEGLFPTVCRLRGLRLLVGDGEGQPLICANIAAFSSPIRRKTACSISSLEPK